ncbi:Inner membrane transport protein ynfM [Oceanobacillus sp. E9]|uniref:MFS transporter n=1 Tax=Oceanobacillus sp. E9 TaxID=1742575 RepID=UPI00084E59CE|nr:MFS transporter [Oceanobacillus sp. E9]OEH55126.1 Inner membrane transport protein ynfM [Oceanobacillus sp. E9]
MKKDNKYGVKDAFFWRISFALALGSFFIFASLYAVQPLSSVFVQEFQISVSQSTLTISMNIVGLIIGLIIFGFISDRIGRTVFIKLSLIGAAIPFLLIPMVDYFILIITLRFVQGFLLAGLPAAALAYISEEIDRRSASIATALYISSNALGGMVGRVLTGSLAAEFSWEIGFYVLAALGIFIFILMTLLLPKSKFFHPSKVSIGKDLQGMLYHLKDPSMIVVFGLGVVLQYAFTSIWTFLPFHLESDTFSMSLQGISNTFYAYGLGIIGAPMAGWLASRLGLPNVQIGGIVVLCLGTALTLSTSVPVIVIGLCIICLGFFTTHSLTAASVTERATHHKGSASSLYLVSYYIGVTLGSSAGPLWNMFGWNGIFTVALMLPLIYILLKRYVQFRVDKKRENKETAI